MTGLFSHAPRERRFYLGNLRGTLPAEERGVRNGTLAAEGDEGTILLLGSGRMLRGLEDALRAQGAEVASRSHAAEALRWMDIFGPDMVVISQDEALRLGKEEASDLARRTRELGIFLVGLSDCRKDHASRLLERGCHDVVCPPHSAASILIRRQVLQSRRTAPSREVERGRRISLGPLTVDLTTRQVTDGDGPVTLSGRELELLVRLMEADGEVVSREELLDDIWGDEQDSAGVLDATVHRLRRKLDGKVGDREMVSTVRGVGYRLDPLPRDVARR